MHTDRKRKTKNKNTTARLEESQSTEGSPADNSTHRLSGGSPSVFTK